MTVILELRRRRRRTRASLRAAWWQFALAVTGFYAVPTGAVLGWWGP